MFGRLPPAGNPVPIHSDGSEAPDSVLAPSPYETTFFASGTAALAAAYHAAARRAGATQPEVILPAYGCPNLLSAAHYAGVRPVLVDLEPGRPWMDLAGVEKQTGNNTVAITAVHFLGVPERTKHLRAIAHRIGALLVEDSAQAFPYCDDEEPWCGDYVVLSFGRGKPISLLGGGALLSRAQRLHNSVLVPPEQKDTFHREALFRLKGVVYNAMRNRKFYWLPQALPFLGIGKTEYRPIDRIGGMDPPIRRRLRTGLALYHSNRCSTGTTWFEYLDSLATFGIVDLAKDCCGDNPPRLLRHPILFPSNAARDHAHSRLTDAGLGSSTLYRSALPSLPRVPLTDSPGRYPAATDFADRLLTLPTHNGVEQRDIWLATRLLRNVLLADSTSPRDH